MTILRYGRSRGVFSRASRGPMQAGQGRDDRVEGEVVEALPNTMVRMTLESGHDVPARVPGTTRGHSVCVLPGTAYGSSSRPSI